MARITSDVGTLLIFLGSGSLQLASDLVLAAGIVGVLLWLRWELAVVSCLAVPLYALSHRAFAGRTRALSAQTRACVGAVYGLLSERISAVRVVRSFAQEEAEVRALDARIDAHRDLSRAGLRLGAWQTALATLTTGAGTVAVLVAGAALLRAGRLTVGDLLAFAALTAQLYNPLVRLLQFHAGAAATRVAIDRMLEVLDAPEKLADRPDARPIRSPLGRLVFDNVSFRYRPDGPPVLDGISLTVEPGMTVGVLGPSGAGKSTLLALAPRLYEADAGVISLDGRDVRQLRLADLRRAVILVPQQAVLFEGTLRSNLLYAAPAASAAALRRVLEAMDLVELVESLPRGLETPVGERGCSLSGGQRQRLALARALLAEPAVLLLDDCTSALDAETEARVREALDELLPGRTRLIVSHRPASVGRADWVVVLEAGRIAEQGRPTDLRAGDGFCAEAHRLQHRAVYG
jgi:ABC-type multidrug transport system fused ATPase/permease subunit